VILCLYAGLGVTLAMALAWLVQRAAGNAGWIDVFWTFSSGLALAIVALAAPGALWRHVLLAALILVWAGRLGGHIAWRVATSPEDTRYALMRAAAGARFQAQMFRLIAEQGPVTGLLAVSVYLAAAQPAQGLRGADIAGVAVLVLALAGEALADQQLRAWRADPVNRGGICEAGLWAFCRHPNYLFEALLWLAYPVIALVPGQPLTWLSFTAPVLMFLVLRYLTGVPPLEAAMLARRGDAYRAYQARTSAMWPRWPR
jgi:steroid 5-alpha reductase family enzyme